MVNCASTMTCAHSSTYLHRLFTYWYLLITLLCSLETVNCTGEAAVNRQEHGDRFTNPFYRVGVKNCANISAQCVKGLLQCSECKCNKATKTYRADIKKCVSKENLPNSTDCRYKGILDAYDGYVDTELPTLDFSVTDSKDFLGQLPQGELICEIQNTTSLFDSQGKWVAVPNITDVLLPRVHDVDEGWAIRRYLSVNWENVGDFYYGRIIKLQISCRTKIDPHEQTGCFLFKSKGHQILADVTSTTTIMATTKQSNRPSSKPETGSSLRSTIVFRTTKKSVINKNYTYNVSMPVIIGVSSGVGFVILIIIILAVCCVRHRIRKQHEAKPKIVNKEASPKSPPEVHLKTEARFSLIQEAAPVVDSDNENYTSLNEKRESYEPYWSLQKDDVDLNVIDNILKDAVSMESMDSSTAPRYSCHLTKDDAIVIESAKPRSPKKPKYEVLEASDDGIEPDYEEVDVDNAATSFRALLDTKPPLPEREYHERQPLSKRYDSEC